MQREQAEFRRGAEAYVRVVLKNFVYWRNLSDGYSGVRVAIKPEPSEKIAFRDLSEMRTWLIDIDNVRKAVNRKSAYTSCEGFDYFGLVGDRLYCDLSFEKMATLRRLSVEGVKKLYWEGIAAIFCELLSRGIDEEYSTIPRIAA